MNPLNHLFELNINGDAVEWNKCRWLAKLRWVILFALLALLIPLFVSGLVRGQNFIWLVGSLSLAMIVNLLWQLHLQNRNQTLNPTVVGFNLLGDLIILSFIIVGTGGVESPFFYSYVLLAALSGVLIKTRYSWSYLVILVSVVAIFYFEYLYFDQKTLTVKMKIAWMFQTGVLFAAWFLFRSFGKVLENQAMRSMQEMEYFQVQEKLRSLGALTAGFSHEFASPLFTVKSSVERSLRQIDKQNSNGARESLNHALLGVRDCEDVIHRMNAAQMDPHSWSYEDIDIIKLVQECVSALEYKNKIKMQLPESFKVSLPRLQFAQVLINILDNAHEVSEVIGLTLQVSQDRWIILEIKDQGTGFAPEVLQFLGEPFRSTKKHGTGLGLYLTRMFCENMGGKLKVNSTSQGATVSLCWPSRSSV